MAITKWLHLEERRGDQWLLPIYSAISNAQFEGKCKAIDIDTREMGVYISTKLNIITHVIIRMNEGVSKIHEKIKDHEDLHVFTKLQQGYAFPIDDPLKYQLIADIETFLFQMNATWELIKKFIAKIYTHAGYATSRKNSAPIIKVVHENNNQNTDWFPLLDKNRNFIAHEGAIYLAVDVSDQDNWDLLIIKKNLMDFELKDLFFTQSDLVNIYQGFLIAKSLIQTDLIELYQ
ncbi:hypothetical protein [Methyloradius palustris]|uniref:Uncharacterized protein n=1 Tax=Methyloradius palustris TaxID=2778876 RepID=A0A8D5G0P4_9PROT|nr:hypothetical protein [Methyloradius palustris]BCM25697.1 hypothetical protein ZMTM_19560 [Methyloradius palustris]